MKKIVILIMVLIVNVLASDVEFFTPSFSCEGVKEGSIEYKICTDVDSSEYDRELVREYRIAKAFNPDVKQSQREWLKERNKCKDVKCLRKMYQDRIEVLRNEVPRRVSYTLAYGKELEVCQAFEREINKMAKYEELTLLHIPYCGTKECGEAQKSFYEVFPHPEIVSFDYDKNQELFFKLQNFYNHNDQDEEIYAEEEKPKVIQRKKEPRLQFRDNFFYKADINNDGVKRMIAVDDKSYDKSDNVLLYLVTPDMKRIDTENPIDVLLKSASLRKISRGINAELLEYKGKTYVYSHNLGFSYLRSSENYARVLSKLSFGYLTTECVLTIKKKDEK